MTCLQCESTRIVENVRCVDRGHSNVAHDLKVEVYSDPAAWVFKGAQGGNLRANVCADCGYVMFTVSVEDARKLEEHKPS